MGVLVAGAGAQVPVERLAGLVTEWQGPLPAALAEDQEHVEVQVDVGELEPNHLRPAGASVQQQHDQCGVAACLEAAASARGEQPLESSRRDDRHGFVGHDRRLHARHRVDVDLLLVDQPGVQDLEDLVVGRRGAGGAAGEQVSHERFQVSARGCLEGGRTDRGALALVGGLRQVGSFAEEGLGLAETDQVGGNGAF